MRTMNSVVDHYKQMFLELDYYPPDEVLAVLAARDLLNEAMVSLRKNCGVGLLAHLSAIDVIDLNLREYMFTYEICGGEFDASTNLIIRSIDHHLGVLNDALSKINGYVKLSTFKVGDHLTLAECYFT